MADQFDSLSPRDVVITLRSLGRRFGEVDGAARSDPAVFAHLDTAGSHGRSLPDIVVEAAQALAFLGNEVDRVIDRDDAVVPRAVLEPDERTFTEPAGRATMADAVQSIATESDRVAARLDHLDAKAWGREADVTGGGQISLLALARECARTAIRELREAEQQLEWLQASVPGTADPNEDWDGTEPA